MWILSYRCATVPSGAMRKDRLAAADQLAIDEDLRHGLPPARALDHLVALRRVRDDVDLDVVHALLLQEALRPRAIGTEQCRIDLYPDHALTCHKGAVNI